MNQPTTTTQTPMTLQKARSVLWLRNNHRPLGELLDEGFLTRDRLEWAARKAYNNQLKQAAGVLLAWMEQTSQAETTTRPFQSAAPLDVGMTVEQARATIWPFGPHRGEAMGTLTDAHCLSLKDLGYAAETAQNDRVRRAALVLIALRLNQVVNEPPSAAGPLWVVSGGTSYAERMQSVLLLVEGVAVGFSSGIMLTLAFLNWIRSIQHSPEKTFFELISSPGGILAFAILMIVVIGGLVTFFYLLGRISFWSERERENWRKGQEGEESVIEVMRQVLDGNWTLFRNIQLPGRNLGDIDAVLVGPPGVWVLEIKTWTGKYRNIGEHWEYHVGGRWKQLKKSPSRQAQTNASRLSAFFKADKISQWVMPVVVWADQEGELTVDNPAVAVWQLAYLPEELSNVWQEQTINKTVRDRIVDKLQRLCRQQGQPAHKTSLDG